MLLGAPVAASRKAPEQAFGLGLAVLVRLPSRHEGAAAVIGSACLHALVDFPRISNLNMEYTAAPPVARGRPAPLVRSSHPSGSARESKKRFNPLSKITSASSGCAIEFPT